MEKIIDEFVLLMHSHGCAPADAGEIIPDDKLRRIASVLDSRGKKSLTYQLSIDGDFGFGWFHSFKHGETVKFVSKQRRGYTAEEKRAFIAKQIEARKLQEAREAEKKSKQKSLALKLKRAFNNYEKAKAHAYLTKKGIEAHGVKIRPKTGELLIPVYQQDGLPWSLQRITESGDKWFMAGGLIDGGFYPLAGKDDAKDVIVIAEGFATAASIRQAALVPTICAFNAGNIKKVAKSFRDKYPSATIVIAADDDRFTKDAKGKTWNVGIEKAKEAAVTVGGFVVAPDFLDGEKGTDWNDYILAHGDGLLREKMRQVTETVAASRSGGGLSEDVPTPSPVRPPVELEGDWRDRLICNEKGQLVRGSIRNAILFLQHHERFAGVFRLNDFQKDIYVTQCPPWTRPERFKVHRLEDNDITLCAAELEGYSAGIAMSNVVKAIATAAEANKFHPAREYFDGLRWDGTERLNTWLSYYLGAEDDEPEYLSFIGKKWLTAAVKRIYEAGCKFDHVLVIEGRQGGGKSTALREMATFNEESYFTDNIKISDISKDNTIMMLQGSLIVELAELAGFNKKDDEEIKGWITVREDRCRRPYDKVVSHFPRQFVLAATTNNYDYLKDPSGNRRYWPMKAGVMDIEAIKRDKLHLWAEAVHWYKQGLYIGPTEEEMQLAKAAQDKRQAVDAWEDDVMRAVDKVYSHKGFKLRDVLFEMGLGIKDRDDRAARRVAAILRANNYDVKALWLDGKTHKVWMRIDD